MSRKKTHKKAHHKRRRSMSGVGGKNVIMNTALVIGGAAIAQLIGKAVGDKVNPKIINAGQIAVGIMMPKFIKSDAGKAIGSGMIAAGGVGLLSSFGVLKGISGLGDTGEYEMEVLDGMSGTEYLSPISGVDDLANVYDDIDSEAGYPMAGVSDLSVLSGTDDMPDHLDYM